MEELKSGRPLSEARRRRILELVQRDGSVTVDRLAEQFGVSAVTVRADLSALSERGAVVRSHGGAVRPLDPVRDYPLALKESVFHSEKKRIGERAAELVKPGQTIILDAGTTTEQVARHLRQRRLSRLTVITNALNIAGVLADAPSTSVLMVGGLLRPLSLSFVGPQAEHMLQGLHADHFFLAVDGMDAGLGVSTPGVLEVELKSLMTRIADEVTVVADASKYGRRSLCMIAGWDLIDRVITDSRLPEAAARELEERDVEVVVV